MHAVVHEWLHWRGRTEGWCGDEGWYTLAPEHRARASEYVKFLREYHGNLRTLLSFCRSCWSSVCARPGRLGVGSILHNSKSVLYGCFVRAHRALDS